MKIIALLFFCLNAYAFDHTHESWDKVLKANTKRVEGQVLFNYQALSKDKKAFNSYLKNLESVSKEDFLTFTNKQKLAFWINAYNAYTVQLILKDYPVKSIKDIGSFFSSPWKKNFIILLGKKMSLDDIEHGTIRKQFKEPRIHFAVNCASIGCPSLLEEAFIADQLNEQLDKATKLFLTNKKKNYVKGHTYYLSKIFDWYEEDFIKYSNGVKNFVSKYLGRADDIEYLDYDWKLNELKN